MLSIMIVRTLAIQYLQTTQYLQGVEDNPRADDDMGATTTEAVTGTVPPSMAVPLVPAVTVRILREVFYWADGVDRYASDGRCPLSAHLEAIIDPCVPSAVVPDGYTMTAVRRTPAEAACDGELVVVPHSAAGRIMAPTGDEAALDATFVDDTHLSMETIMDAGSAGVTTLQELGYTDEYVTGGMPTAVAQSTVFRVMTDEGTLALRQSISAQEVHAQTSTRIPKVLRGAAFRSPFIRDLSVSVPLTHALSRLAGVGLLPHPMRIMHGHTNMLAVGSDRVRESVDKWHYDTVAFVLIIFVTDPSEYTGESVGCIPSPHGLFMKIRAYSRGHHPAYFRSRITSVDIFL